MLKNYFEAFLRKRGFTELARTFYSLSYCQGDGASFECEIGYHQLRELIPHIIASSPMPCIDAFTRRMHLWKLSQSMEFGECGAISIGTDRNSRYCHSNTMNFSTEWYHSPDNEDNEGNEELLFGIANDILDYAKSCADAFVSDGYALIEAMSYEEKTVREYRTENYLVRVNELPTEIDHLDPWEWDDDDAAFETCQQLIQGQYRVSSISVGIYDSNEELLAENSLHEIFHRPNDPSYGKTVSECFQSALTEYRDRCKEIQKAA